MALRWPAATARVRAPGGAQLLGGVPRPGVDDRLMGAGERLVLQPDKAYVRRVRDQVEDDASRELRAPPRAQPLVVERAADAVDAGAAEVEREDPAHRGRCGVVYDPTPLASLPLGPVAERRLTTRLPPPARRLAQPAARPVRLLAGLAPREDRVDGAPDLVALVVQPQLAPVDEDAGAELVAEVGEVPPLALLAPVQPVLRVGVERLDPACLDQGAQFAPSRPLEDRDCGTRSSRRPGSRRPRARGRRRALARAARPGGRCPDDLS